MHSPGVRDHLIVVVDVDTAEHGFPANSRDLRQSALAKHSVSNCVKAVAFCKKDYAAEVRSAVSQVLEYLASSKGR